MASLRRILLTTHYLPIIRRSSRLLCLLLLLSVFSWAQQDPSDYPQKFEGDWNVPDFTFQSGEKLADLRLHYITLGSPERDTAGHVRNAVLILHGTGGIGGNFLSTEFGGELFGKGQPLDATRYYIILPDAIGAGKSSKPSDGLRMKFPHYRYHDMVYAQYLLVHDGLKVDHLRLVMGTSQGGMHTWLWGVTYPNFMDALMPMASAPIEIAGRNRMTRIMAIQAIKNDPDWKNGEYTTQPRGLIAARNIRLIMTGSALQFQKENPTAEKADAAVEAMGKAALQGDANDTIYQYEASTDYNPSPLLEKIQAPLFAINSADDEINPPELGILEREIEHVKQGRYILIPLSNETRGHQTYNIAVVWKNHLLELLHISDPRGAPPCVVVGACKTVFGDR
jgi:homoserine O-acetyltransferase/O-succinyltransferase